MSDLPDRPLRVEEVAAFWNVTTRTIYLWLEHGKLQRADSPSRVITITRDSAMNGPPKRSPI